MWARVQRCDLAVQSISLDLEVIQVVPRCRQSDIGQLAFLPRALPTLQIGDQLPVLLDLRLDRLA